VDELETVAGVCLLARGSSGVVPTPIGAELAERGRHILAQAAALLSSTRWNAEHASGTVRMLVPIGIPINPATWFVAETLARWPDVRLGTYCVEDPFDDLIGSAEMALTVGAKIPSGPWEVHDLLPFDDALLASPAYLASHPPIQTVADLAAHRLLVWHVSDDDSGLLPLRDGTHVHITPHFVTNRNEVVHQLAQSGFGIGLALDSDLPVLRAGLPGTLQPVLPHLVGRQRWVRLVVSEGVARLQRVKVVVDTVLEVTATMRALPTKVASVAH
jgi:DNA-binding transcriptional LysR family regulator